MNRDHHANGDDQNGHAPAKARLDVDRVTFRLEDGQLTIDGQTDPLSWSSLVALESMIAVAVRQKRRELADEGRPRKARLLGRWCP